MSHAKREVGAACALLLAQRRSRDNRLVGRTVARVSLEDHIANYRVARAGNSELRCNAGEGAAGLSNSSRATRVREQGNSAKKGARKSVVKKAKPQRSDPDDCLQRAFLFFEKRDTAVCLSRVRDRPRFLPRGAKRVAHLQEETAARPAY